MLGRRTRSRSPARWRPPRAQDLPHELLDAAEVRRRFPAFTPADDDVGLYEEVAGLLRPRAAITALLEQARTRKAQVRTGVAVRGWDADTAGVVVHTDHGDIRADRLVLAPGAWAPQLCRLDIPFRVQRRVQHGGPPIHLCSSRAGFPPGSGATARPRRRTVCPLSMVWSPSGAVASVVEGVEQRPSRRQTVTETGETFTRPRVAAGLLGHRRDET